jgi:hypothetical protein
MLVCHQWTDVSNFAIRAMVVKQGMAVTSAGKGELSAAYECFNELVGVVTPMVWASLFGIFSKGGTNALVRFLGPGGHFILAAVLRLVARQLVCSIPQDALYSANVDDGDDSDGGKK